MRDYGGELKMAEKQPSTEFVAAYLKSPAADEVTQQTVTRLQGIERMTGNDLGSNGPLTLPAGEIAKAVKALNTETQAVRPGPAPKTPTMH